VTEWLGRRVGDYSLTRAEIDGALVIEQPMRAGEHVRVRGFVQVLGDYDRGFAIALAPWPS